MWWHAIISIFMKKGRKEEERKEERKEGRKEGRKNAPDEIDRAVELAARSARARVVAVARAEQQHGDATGRRATAEKQ